MLNRDDTLSNFGSRFRRLGKDILEAQNVATYNIPYFYDFQFHARQVVKLGSHLQRHESTTSFRIKAFILLLWSHHYIETCTRIDFLYCMTQNVKYFYKSDNFNTIYSKSSCLVTVDILTANIKNEIHIQATGTR